jgi:hypothetical protein
MKNYVKQGALALGVSVLAGYVVFCGVVIYVAYKIVNRPPPQINS